MEIGTAHVERLPLSPVEDDRGDEIGDQTDDRDDEHHAGLDLDPLPHATERRDRDPHRDDADRAGIDGRSQDLGATEAVGGAAGGGAGTDEHRQCGDDEAAGIGEHVPGVRQQRQRSGDDAADDLGDEDHRGDADDDPEPLPPDLRMVVCVAVGVSVGVSVGVAVQMIMAVVVTHQGPSRFH